MNWDDWLTSTVFNNTIIHDAYRLRMATLAAGHDHDELYESAVFLVTSEGWREIRRLEDSARSAIIIGPGAHKMLFGIPIRITHDDDPTEDCVQLLLRPELRRTK